MLVAWQDHTLWWSGDEPHVVKYDARVSTTCHSHVTTATTQWRRYTRARQIKWPGCKIHRPGFALAPPCLLLCFASVIVWTENKKIYHIWPLNALFVLFWQWNNLSGVGGLSCRSSTLLSKKVHQGDLARGCSDLEMIRLFCCAGAVTATTASSFNLGSLIVSVFTAQLYINSSFRQLQHNWAGYKTQTAADRRTDGRTDYAVMTHINVGRGDLRLTGSSFDITNNATSTSYDTLCHWHSAQC